MGFYYFCRSDRRSLARRIWWIPWLAGLVKNTVVATARIISSPATDWLAGWLTDWLADESEFLCFMLFAHWKMWQKRQLWQLWRERACERNSLLKRNVLTGNLNNKTTCKNWMHIYHNFLSGCAEQRHHHFRRLGISFAFFSFLFLDFARASLAVLVLDVGAHSTNKKNTPKSIRLQLWCNFFDDDSTHSMWCVVYWSHSHANKRKKQPC